MVGLSKTTTFIVLTVVASLHALPQLLDGGAGVKTITEHNNHLTRLSSPGPANKTLTGVRHKVFDAGRIQYITGTQSLGGANADNQLNEVDAENIVVQVKYNNVTEKPRVPERKLRNKIDKNVSNEARTYCGVKLTNAVLEFCNGEIKSFHDTEDVPAGLEDDEDTSVVKECCWNPCVRHIALAKYCLYPPVLGINYTLSDIQHTTETVRLHSTPLRRSNSIREASNQLIDEQNMVKRQQNRDDETGLKQQTHPRNGVNQHEHPQTGALDTQQRNKHDKHGKQHISHAVVFVAPQQNHGIRAGQQQNQHDGIEFQLNHEQQQIQYAVLLDRQQNLQKSKNRRPRRGRMGKAWLMMSDGRKDRKPQVMQCMNRSYAHYLLRRRTRQSGGEIGRKQPSRGKKYEVITLAPRGCPDCGVPIHG